MKKLRWQKVIIRPRLIPLYIGILYGGRVWIPIEVNVRVKQ